MVHDIIRRRAFRGNTKNRRASKTIVEILTKIAIRLALIILSVRHNRLPMEPIIVKNPRKSPQRLITPVTLRFRRTTNMKDVPKYVFFVTKTSRSGKHRDTVPPIWPNTSAKMKPLVYLDFWPRSP